MTPEVKQVLSSVGILVIASQSIESLLNLILTFVIQDGVPLSYERIMHLEGRYRRETLGGFIREMKKRADLESSLEESLNRYLENRNKLIHRINEVPGHSLETSEDVAAMNAFLSLLTKDMMTVMRFCSALTLSWSKQIGMPADTLDSLASDDLQPWIDEVKAVEPLLDQLIFAKNK